jgi:hypothetical protein
MLSQLEDSKKDALESQIMNDSYDFSNHEKMPPEDDAYKEVEEDTFYFCFVKVSIKKRIY